MRYNRLYKDNDFLTPTTYTQELSEYAEQLSYEDIPPEVVERAKMILLQTIGAALAAKETPIAEKAVKMAREAAPAALQRSGEWMRRWLRSMQPLSWEPSAMPWTGRTAPGPVIRRPG